MKIAVIMESAEAKNAKAWADVESDSATKQDDVTEGKSSEGENAAASQGDALAQALVDTGHTPVPLAPTSNLARVLRDEKPDALINALPGTLGHDGSIERLSEYLGIPYIGTDATHKEDAWDASHLRESLERYTELIDDDLCASLPFGIAIDKASYSALGLSSALDLMKDRIPGGYPMCVKPVRAGSGVGVCKVSSEDELKAALEAAFELDSRALVQQWVEGVEISVVMLGSEWDAYPLPLVKVAPQSKIFDSVTRKSEGAGAIQLLKLEDLSPDPVLADGIRADIERAALQVFRAVGATDFARIDLIWDGAQPRILDVDLAPSIAKGSRFAAALDASDLTLPALLDSIIGQYA